METNHHPKLTSTEISNLWTTFQGGTMTICGVKYFLANVKDKSIRDLLQYSLDFTKKRLQTITQILNAENYPIPVGFTEQDVDTEAPRLFSDSMILFYMLNMGRLGLTGESLLFSLSARDDIAAFYSECVTQSKELVDRGRKLAIDKGIFIRPPYLPTPNQVDFVKKQSFLNGWLGDRRPLLGIEIANLVYNSERNALGEALITGFSQVVRSKDVRQYMLKGREISGKHFEIFSSVLHEEHLSATLNMTSEVTDSTVPPFSDKLMMFHIAGLVASGIGQYGAATSVSPRRDLGMMYTRLMAEIVKYSEDGANIMIDNGWMEQPPMAADRDELAKRKG
ncbi:hypothetical protein JOC86_001980 [Bacillus pakistanensis]|uniref:DUF3231 family protein n=1 Tax=Rossellomorea pakistanensis TaxID=992288 RepID=A0ABS2NC51_9BACI|nr:DUF3231 family protein [Bacillus pakistanensis]MBM7585438.1 hypothetical protein [Bacillus pakistanensis]